ncbi:hypothetical protein MIDIC_170009 [Alphaproteobacteria bacterium]
MYVTLPNKGVVKTSVGVATGTEIVLEIANAGTQGAIKIGKFFVRMNPWVAATLPAYEIYDFAVNHIPHP